MSQQVHVYKTLTLQEMSGVSARFLAGTSSDDAGYTAGTPPITLYFTAAGASTTSLEPFYLKSTVTGTSPVGGRARFHTYCNVTAGGWLNALKGYMEFGAAGKVTGLGSAVCAEVVFPAATFTGTYGVLEGEVYAPASAAFSSSTTSFLYLNVDGDSTAKTSFNTYGYLFQLGSGIVDTANGLLDAITSDASPVFEYRVRVKAAGVDMYIPVSTSATFAG